MGFIENIRLVSDKVYKIRDTYLCKIGNIFRCYIVKNNKTHELEIDSRFNTIYKLCDWIIILADRNSAEVCVINVYKHNTKVYKWQTDREEKLYREYIKTSLSNEFIQDLILYSKKDSNAVNINKYNDYIHLRFNISGIHEINAICYSDCKKWLLTPLDNLTRVKDYGYGLWVLGLNGYSHIFYKGKVSDYTLIDFPVCIEGNSGNKSVIFNCNKMGKYFRLIFKLDGSEYKIIQS